MTRSLTAARPGRRVAARAVALGIVGGGLGLAAALGHTAAPTPRVLASCDETVDTTDSFSMACVPTVIPDVSDQLTEAEVAQPGWNASPGGSGPRR